MSRRPPIVLPRTEALPRVRTTDAIPELSPADKLPVTAVAERVIEELWHAIVGYNLRHPRMLTSAMSRAAMDMQKTRAGHNLAEQSTRLTIVVGELDKDPAIALHPLVRPALEQAQRFLRYGTTPGH